MKQLSIDDAHRWLRVHGVASDNWINEIVGGFDFSRPVYEQPLYPGDALFQFIRAPHFHDPSPVRGSWFCLAGASKGSLAIFDGISGRRLMKFRVRYPAFGLEGTAAKKLRNWSWAGGGRGGASQLFLPPSQIMSVEPVGAHEPW